MFETLGHYKILDRLGAAGMGEVYRARDTRLGRTVAIKVLKADVAGDPVRRDRFLQEARATAVLSHPNIAALYEIGEDQGQLFLAFEYVPGETLKSVIAGRPLNPRRAIDLAVQLADALADAHAAGIIHRDIKPENIIVTPKGHAKILDFGLATWTSSGAAAYMSPEQARGEPIDSRTDIFSLGVVMFEMLTGRLPFSGATPAVSTLQIVEPSVPVPLPSSMNKTLPSELDAVVAKALAKSLEHRYESAVMLAADLRGVSATLAARSATQEAAAPFVPAQRARRTGGRWILVVLMLAALCVAAWFGRHYWLG